MNQQETMKRHTKYFKKTCYLCEKKLQWQPQNNNDAQIPASIVKKSIPPLTFERH